MKLLSILALVALMLSGCATSWPERGPDYWATHVEENPPFSNAEAEVFPFGEVEPMQLADDADFTFKLVETMNHAPLWIIEVRPDHSGFFIFQELMYDGAIIRGRERKVDFTLSDAEYRQVRQAIIDSGFLEVRQNCTGTEEHDWNVGVRANDRLKVVEFNGGYPEAARKVVYGVYNIVVKPRSAEMATAPDFKPKDWETAPENQPLR
ncbi:MAG: hypothetical protein IT464_16140 [Planctomycetes bacterium]|nr:hypothetical protein [Planctomycetota bacterium]